MAKEEFMQTAGYPVSKRMSPRYEGTFAYTTVKERMPRILTQVIDTTHREEGAIRAKLGEAGTEDVKACIAKLGELRYQLQTNKEMPVIASGLDTDVWTTVFESYRTSLNGAEPTWFNVSWLFAECYMYRRITEIFSNSPSMKEYDPFAHQKEASFMNSLPQIITLAGFVSGLLSKPTPAGQDLRVDFEHLLLLCLWGNKLDLSMMASVDSYDSSQDHFSSDVGTPQQAQLLRTNILADHSSTLWELLELVSRPKTCPRRVDFVLDNAGFEIFSDLCLADWLLTVGFADKIQLHLKHMPWFVSDALVKDLTWMLDTLVAQTDTSLSSLGRRWKGRIEDSSFVAVDHSFWTTSYEYTAMKTIAPDLYQQLSESHLVIFKGDLNYRKLLADRNWMYTESFTMALGGFEPTNLCALRTLKADLVTGLAPGVAEETAKKNKDWMITGQYAVLQVHKN